MLKSVVYERTTRFTYLQSTEKYNFNKLLNEIDYC